MPGKHVQDSGKEMNPLQIQSALGFGGPSDLEHVGIYTFLGERRIPESCISYY